jgi:gamma-glutamyltranspeptidase
VRFAGEEHLSAGWNCQGVFHLEGLAALEVLATRRGRPLDPLGSDAAAVARVLSAAAAHRDALLGDPAATAGLAERLLDPARTDRLAAWADGEDVDRQELLASAAGAPSAGGRRSGDTVAVVVADGRGGWVSLIQSAFHAFGAAVVDPATGILLHNRGASFSLVPGSPNELGPGRRPLHTLMPVMTRSVDGEVTGAHGTMGGRAQHQIHAQLALQLAGGAGAAGAVSAPRWILGRMGAGTSAQDADRTASVEAGVPAAAREVLAAGGFDCSELPDRSDHVGHSQLVRREAGGTAAATDPRADGAALTGPVSR